MVGGRACVGSIFSQMTHVMAGWIVTHLTRILCSAQNLNFLCDVFQWHTWGWETTIEIRMRKIYLYKWDTQQKLSVFF